MTPYDASTPCHDPSLLGVMIRYCEGTETKNVWIDLDKVHGISWCDEEVKAKQKGNGGPNRLPWTKDPGPCAELVHPMGSGTPVCWWDGTKWECGEAME